MDQATPHTAQTKRARCPWSFAALLFVPVPALLYAVTIIAAYCAWNVYQMDRWGERIAGRMHLFWAGPVLHLIGAGLASIGRKRGEPRRIVQWAASLNLAGAVLEVIIPPLLVHALGK